MRDSGEVSSGEALRVSRSELGGRGGGIHEGDDMGRCLSAMFGE